MRPIGSEKISNVDDKLARIKEIAGIKTTINENVNSDPHSTILHEAIAANGEEYAIVKEENYVYIKKRINETYDYLSGIQNIKEYSYRTYAEALKHLNLMFKDINESVDHADNIDLFKKKA